MSGDPVAYLEGSFLSPLLVQEGVTDISYNGESLFYVSNDKGRQRSSIEAKKEDVSSFLRQLANLTEKQFSVQSPFLDVSFGRYRINAVNSSLARRRNQKTYTFSLRLESNDCKITDDSGFFDKKSSQILRRLIKEGESIVSLAREKGVTEGAIRKKVRKMRDRLAENKDLRKFVRFFD